MDELIERVRSIENQLAEVLSLLRGKETTAVRQHRYYVERKRRAAKAAGAPKLRNPDKNIFALRCGKDNRLAKHWVEWAKVGLKFGAAVRPYAFLEWLCWAWQNVYQERPLTRSGGYNQVFYGWSNNKPLRTKTTDSDLFGNLKRLSFNRVQKDQFSDALWWRWGYGVLFQVLGEMQEMEGYEALSDRFLRPIKLMCGTYGHVELKQDLFFETELDCKQLSKVYRLVKPELDRCWQACMKGLRVKEEPVQPALITQ